MPAEVDYLPVATSVAANVDTQANFAGSGYQENGFQVGIALPNQANKVWRQASMIGACIANFISQVLNINVLDDGNLSGLITNFMAAIRQFVLGVFGTINLVTWSATPTFDLNLGLVQEITLIGNVTSSTCVNVVAGYKVVFIIHQDSTGGRAFAWPSNVPGAVIDPAGSATSVQQFIADHTGTLRPLGPMTSS